MPFDAGAVIGQAKLNTAEFDKGVDDVKVGSKQVEKSMGGLTKSIRAAVGKIRDVARAGAAAIKRNEQAIRTTGATATAVGAAFTAVSAAQFKLAADGVESVNRFNRALGDLQVAGNDWAMQYSSDLHLALNAVQDFTANTFLMTKNMGFTESAAFDLSKQVTQLTFDMASYYTLPVEQAFSKIQAGLVGQSRPLLELGIIVNEATTKTFAYTNAIAEQGKKLTDLEKIQARFGLIMQGTADAQGDLRRTMESSANETKRMGVEIKELAQSFGDRLLPSITPIIHGFNEMLSGIREWVDEAGMAAKITANLTLAIGAFGVVLGPILIALPTLVAGIAAITASPFGLVAIGVVALGVAFTALAGAMQEVAQSQEEINEERAQAFTDIESLEKLYVKLKATSGDTSLEQSELKATTAALENAYKKLGLAVKVSDGRFAHLFATLKSPQIDVLLAQRKQVEKSLEDIQSFAITSGGSAVGVRVRAVEARRAELIASMKQINTELKDLGFVAKGSAKETTAAIDDIITVSKSLADRLKDAGITTSKQLRAELKELNDLYSTTSDEIARSALWDQITDLEDILFPTAEKTTGPKSLSEMFKEATKDIDDTAEATEGLDVAMVGLIETSTELSRATDATIRGFMTAEESLTGLMEGVTGGWTSDFEEFFDRTGSMLLEWEGGWEGVFDSIDNLFKNMLRSIITEMNTLVSRDIAQSLMSSVRGQTGVNTATAALSSNFLSSFSTQGFGDTALGSFFGFADGGSVFGKLSKHGIVDTPTPMIAGENNRRERILNADETANMERGIFSAGKAAGSVVVNLTNASGTPVEAEAAPPRQTPDGMVVDVIINALHGNTNLRNAVKGIM